MKKTVGIPRDEDENDWLSVSDLMAGLMVIFLFVAIVFIRPLAETNRQMKEIAEAWQQREEEIYQALSREFQDDLPKWNAIIIRKTLLIRFNSPEILFETGEDQIRPEFKTILDDFYPRYVRVLKPFRKALDELRIEGHTSSEWENSSPSEAYIENMRLSQDRTRAVLEYVLNLVTIENEHIWLRRLVTANGLSSSRTIRTPVGLEDPVRSRRVEFRVRTNADSQIARILETAQ